MKFLDLCPSEPVGFASLSMSVVCLSSCSSGGADTMPRVSLPLVVPPDASHLVDHSHFTNSGPRESAPSPNLDKPKRRCPLFMPLSVLPPLFLDQYAIPPHVLQNPTFKNAVLQSLPHFSNMSLQSSTYPIVPSSSMTSSSTLSSTSMASTSSLISYPLQFPSIGTSPVVSTMGSDLQISSFPFQFLSGDLHSIVPI
ncbi:hypothetical protein NE237_015003 [Protea cynaroides]|uniref:Uncharacterized protein n=1 Tax=Protea cynaroides TaxID=273540 RepID=A0A9Q0KD88_9MAGN|nr:hypothetical protein NE237_015003 [Protea cynaroides]